LIDLSLIRRTLRSLGTGIGVAVLMTSAAAGGALFTAEVPPDEASVALSATVVVTPVDTMSATPAPARPRVGLVLSGGGARGFAHIGILKMLDSLRVPVDFIAGTSMGGIMGALYAIGYSSREIEELVLDVSWRELFNDAPPRELLPYFHKRETGRYQLRLGFTGFKPAPLSGLIFGQNISLRFAGFTFPYERVRDFERLPVPFRCVAIDLITGNQVILKQGSLARAMRATMAIPTVFSPVAWGDSLLVDGGTANNLPVDVVKEMGAEVVIAVDVAKVRERQQLDSALEVMGQWLTVTDAERKRENLAQVDVLIRPDISRFTMADFTPDAITDMIGEGEKAARSSLQQLQALQREHGLYLDSPPTDTGATDTLRPHPGASGGQVIASIVVTGNRYCSTPLIMRLLEFAPGDELIAAELNHRIDKMYSLGYFEQIVYDLTPAGDDRVNLELTIKELPFQQLRFGLRYDDVHQLVVAVSARTTNLLLPGLNSEHELQAGGLFRFTGRAYLQSRTLDFPVYPFLDLAYRDVPSVLYDDRGNESAHFDDRAAGIGVGLGLVLFKSLNVEAAYRHEYMDTRMGPGSADVGALLVSRDRLRHFAATLHFDTLDDVFLPRRGCRLSARFEQSRTQWETSRPYELAALAAEGYLTWLDRHTVRLYGFRGTCSRDTPVYKFMNQGRQNTFVGVMYNQLFGSRLSVARLEYRYRQNPALCYKLIGNLAPDYRYRVTDGVRETSNIWGVGIGVKAITPLGPLEIIGSYGHLQYTGHLTEQYVLNFRFGYEF